MSETWNETHRQTLLHLAVMSTSHGADLTTAVALAAAVAHIDVLTVRLAQAKEDTRHAMHAARSQAFNEAIAEIQRMGHPTDAEIVRWVENVLTRLRDAPAPAQEAR